MQRTGWIRTEFQNESFDWEETWVIDRDTVVSGETWYSLLQLSPDAPGQGAWRSGWHSSREDGLWRFDDAGRSEDAELWIPKIDGEGGVVTTTPGVAFMLVGVTDEGRSRTYRRTTARLAGVDIDLPEPQVDVFRTSETEGFVYLSDFVFSSDNGGPWHKTMQGAWNLIRFEPGPDL